MSLPKINNFNDYTVGASTTSDDEASSNLVSPTYSIQSQPELRPPLSRSHPSFGSLQQLNGYQCLPLTQDRLAKNDKMDILLDNRPVPGAKHTKRRRSISDGHLARKLYNEDSKPTNIELPYTKRSSDHSDASINSPTSSYNRHAKMLGNKYMPEILSNSFTSNKQNNTSKRIESERIGSSQAQTYGSFATSQQQQVSRSRSIYSNNSWTPLHEQLQREGPPRRFSGLVRLSAAHIAMGRRAKNNKKKIYQSTFYRVLSRLTAIASRVVDTRTLEPADTRMSVDELTSLSNYLQALKSGNYDNNSNSGSTTRSSMMYRPRFSPRIELLVNNNENIMINQQDNSSSNHLSPNDGITTPVFEQKKHLSSLGNIFPFAPINRIPTIARSASERSQQLDEQEEPTETDRLLPSTSPIRRTRRSSNYFSRQMTSFLEGCSKFLEGQFLHPVFDSYHQLRTSTQIRFEGWSLYIFGPTSLTRFYLWTVIGSRWFELFILTLLFTQWILLSFVPIRFNTDKPFFSGAGDYILFFIYIIYTFEAISKIIVYGIISSKHSTERPTIKALISRIQYNHQRKPSIFSNIREEAMDQQEDDTISTYTPRRQSYQLPAFAAQRSISSGNSQRNASTLSSASHERNGDRNSGESILSEPVSGGENIPPWASSANSSLSIFDEHHLHPASVSHNTINKRRATKPKYNEREIEEAAINDETISILTTAEQHVLASLTPNVDNRNTENYEHHEDFLKVSHGSYLSCVANVVDIVSIISYWIDVIMILGFSKQPWSVFQAMAATRLLRFLVFTEGTTVIMKSLRSSYDMLKNVMGFFLFFWLLLSLVGLLIFMNAFSRRCAVIPQGQPLVKNMLDIQYVEPRISCSGYMISETERTGVFDIHTGRQYSRSGRDGLFCKLGQVCIQDTANQPKFGYMTFENIFYTMLNILTVISTEDWTDLLYISQDSISNHGAAFFYSFCIYLMTFIMVPMFIAVITTSFSHVRGDMRESAFSSKRKAKPSAIQKPPVNHHDDNDHEEWIYEGMGLGEANMFQTRSIFQGLAHRISNAGWFPYVGSILVVLNTITMILYTAELSNQQNAMLDSIWHTFTIIFSIEILIRMYGYSSWREFWSRLKNRVDLLIVIATVIHEISYVKNSQYHIHLFFFSVLRTYRISYLFPGVLQLMSDVLGDGQGISNLTFFTFLILFLLSPISVQLFGGDFTFVDDSEPSMRFDNFYQALLALFQIMTGENWTDILYNAMHSQEHSSVTCAALFMIFLYFTVHYMVLNLFIAVIMENFDLDEEDIKQIQIKKYIREHRSKPEYFKMDRISRLLLPLFIKQDERKVSIDCIPQNLVAHVTDCKFKEFFSEEDTLDSPRRSDCNMPTSTHQNLVNISLLVGKRGLEQNIPSKGSSVVVPSFKRGHSRQSSNMSGYSNRSLHLEPSSPVIYGLSTYEATEAAMKYDDEYELNVARENKAVIVENLNVFRSIAVLKNDNALRQLCVRLAVMKSYNWTVVALIFISTVLAIWSEKSNRLAHPIIVNRVIEPIQTIFLLASWMDIFIHMVADGVFMLPKSYLRSTWNASNMLNLTAQVVLTILSVLYGEDDSGRVSYVGYLRIVRSLRAIRIVYYVQGMRTIFLDLVYGLPKMIDAVTLNFLVFIPFAIYGGFLFSGKFTSCNDDLAESIAGCYGEFKSTDENSSDILLPRVWKNPYDYSFDSFGKSLLHLFECASGEGWILSLFSAMSVPENKTDQAKFSWSSSSIFHSLYYVVFMFVASLCSIQLFIGVFLEIFKQRSGISSLTNTQRQFQDLQRQLALVKPSRLSVRPTDSNVRAWFYDLVIDKRGKFARFMATVLTANIIVFATEHMHQPQWLTYLQIFSNGIFLCLYMFEMGAKITGLGFSKWASIRWNIYDFVLVSASTVTSILAVFIELPYGWDVARKLFLVGLVFRLAQRNESLDTLFRSVKRAVPSIFFVSAVFAIVIVCFGVIFQENFSSTRYGPYGNDHANFRSLFNTVLTLFRITTGENWDFLMHDYAVLPPGCVGKGDCGSPKLAFTLFIIFYVVCTYIFVNLFTVIVIDNFSFTFDKRNQFTLITRTDLRHFKTAWSTVDPNATGYICKEDVAKFLRNLEGVLSIRIYEKEHSIPNLLKSSDRMDSDTSHFIAVPLSYRKMSDEFGEGNNMIRERFFNIHELHRTLSNIDPQIIRERKRKYTVVDQEILNSASYRGIWFYDMLEILAVRLVDISKSLTFDELVNRARIQDKIAKDLAAERIKGLVDMIILRREYLKDRQRLRNSQFLRRKNNVGSWLSPSGSRMPSPSIERSDLFSQLHPTLLESSKRSDLNIPKINTGVSISCEGVPTVVVDRAQSLSNPALLSDYMSQQMDLHTLKLPDTFAKTTKSNKTDGAVITRRKPTSTITPLPSSSTSSSSLGISPPKTYTARPSSLSIRRIPLDTSIISPAKAINDVSLEALATDNSDDDVFTQYYAIDNAMDDMTSPDAEKIVDKFQHSTWSNLLNEESE